MRLTDKKSRRSFIKAAGMGALALSASPLAARAAARARVAVLPEALHRLPRTQYGHFIEHLGMCVKGGIWAEGESDDMFLGGVRWELLEAIRSLNPPLIRYPGGCFADGYHWKDGIGPRNERPLRFNRMWGKLGPLVGPVEDNHFGTDEFLSLCEAVGAEPMITANVGSGTPAEAADWVEYCNGPADSKWGRARADNGHPDPWRVKYWFAGNEIFSPAEIGNMKPPEYVRAYREFSEAMRRRDPGIKLIAVGNHLPGSAGRHINKAVLEGVGGDIDYLSVHKYVPAPNFKNALRYQVGRMESLPSRSVYNDVMSSVAEMEDFVKECARDCRSHSPGPAPVPLAFDEWNLWYNFAEDIVKTNYCLRDGVWTASMLNMFHRHAESMPVANIAQLVNCLGIVSSTRRGTFLTPSALAFKLYAERAGEELLPSEVDGPDLPGAGVPALDVSATRGREGLALFLVNRDPERGIVAEIDIEGAGGADKAETFTMTHPDPIKYNTHREPRAVSVGRRVLPIGSPGGQRAAAETLVPPCSLVCLSVAAGIEET